MPRIDANEIIRVHLCNSMTKTTWKGRIKAMRILPTNLHEWTRMMVDVFLIRVNSCGFVDKKTVCQNNLGFPLKGRIKAMMVLPTNLHEFTRMMVNGFWIRVNSCGFVGKNNLGFPLYFLPSVRHTVFLDNQRRLWKFYKRRRDIL